MLRIRVAFAALGAAAIMMTPVARADDNDDYKSLMADCDRPDLPYSDIRDCVERARVLAYVRPSPQLQRLITQLERRWDDGDGNDQVKPTAASSGPHPLLGAGAASPQPRFAGKDAEKKPREINAPDDDGSAPSAVKDDHARSRESLEWLWPF